MKTTLPEWMDVMRKREKGVPLNPLEQFVFANEPAGSESEEEFRCGLIAAINFVVEYDRGAEHV